MSEKIKTGLNALDRDDPDDDTPLAHLAGAPKNLSEIVAAHDRVDRNADRLKQFSNIGESIEAYRADLESYWLAQGNRRPLQSSLLNRWVLN